MQKGLCVTLDCRCELAGDFFGIGRSDLLVAPGSAREKISNACGCRPLAVIAVFESAQLRGKALGGFVTQAHMQHDLSGLRRRIPRCNAKSYNSQRSRRDLPSEPARRTGCPADRSHGLAKCLLGQHAINRQVTRTHANARATGEARKRWSSACGDWPEQSGHCL